MTNLDSIVKSRDITLPTKVRLVKALSFPVVMYGCESWTMKKAERRRIDAFEMWCWRRLLSYQDNFSCVKVHPILILKHLLPFSSTTSRALVSSRNSYNLTL